MAIHNLSYNKSNQIWNDSPSLILINISLEETSINMYKNNYNYKKQTVIIKTYVWYITRPISLK